MPTIKEIEVSKECLKRNKVIETAFEQGIKASIEVLKNPKKHSLIAQVWAKKSIDDLVEFAKAPPFFKDGHKGIIRIN